MTPEHLDPSIPLDVPDEIRERLRKNGNQHRYRAKRINEKHGTDEFFNEIEVFDVTDLYDEQNWTCNVCYKRVDIYAKKQDPMSPVCGHMNNLRNFGGHTRANVFCQHKSCNDWLCHAIEKRREKKIRSLSRSHRGVNPDGTKPKPKFKKPIPARPEGLTGQSKWAKGRKIQKRVNPWS